MTNEKRITEIAAQLLNAINLVAGNSILDYKTRVELRDLSHNVRVSISAIESTFCKCSECNPIIEQSPIQLNDKCVNCGLLFDEFVVRKHGCSKWCTKCYDDDLPF